MEKIRLPQKKYMNDWKQPGKRLEFLYVYDTMNMHIRVFYSFNQVKLVWMYSGPAVLFCCIKLIYWRTER